MPDAQIHRLRACYAGKVDFMDHCLGYFLDALESTGLSKNTAIILTADHGTCLGEGDKFSKRVFTEIGEPECHVPMMIHLPGVSGYRTDAIVQPHDIFPTVLEIAGIDSAAASDGVDGTSILTDPPRPDIALASAAPCHGWKDDPALTLFAAFTDTWCLSVAARTKNCRLYRLGSNDNVAAEHPDLVNE